MMKNKETYRMSELVDELGLNKGQISYLIDQYRDLVEIYGEKTRTRYSQKTLDTLRAILKLKAQGKSVNEIKTDLGNIKEGELSPTLRITIDVNFNVNLRF